MKEELKPKNWKDDENLRCKLVQTKQTAQTKSTVYVHEDAFDNLLETVEQADGSYMISELDSDSREELDQYIEKSVGPSFGLSA